MHFDLWKFLELYIIQYIEGNLPKKYYFCFLTFKFKLQFCILFGPSIQIQ